MDLSALTLESAKQLVGTIFEVTLENGAVTTMKLDDAIPLEFRHPRRSRVKAKRAPFSLYFLGDPAMVLPQGMYAFRSAAATFENLFIVPVGRDEEATEYEAVFN